MEEILPNINKTFGFSNCLWRDLKRFELEVASAIGVLLKLNSGVTLRFVFAVLSNT